MLRRKDLIMMNEISITTAMTVPYLLIDMEHPVKGYENYPNFHAGTKCKVNGFPYQLMYENGEYSLEAEAIAITAWKRKGEPERINFKSGEIITVIAFANGSAKAFEFQLPNHIPNMQSVVLK